MFNKLWNHVTRTKEIDYLISLLLSDDFSLTYENLKNIIQSQSLESLILEQNITVIKFTGSNISSKEYERVHEKISQLSDGQKSILILKIESIRNYENINPLLNKAFKEYFSLIPILFTFLLAGMTNVTKIHFFPIVLALTLIGFVIYMFLFLTTTTKEDQYNLKYHLLELLLQ